MMSDDAQEVTTIQKPGLPAWVVTFGNLMSLLMCFFVLQLSVAQVETQKFKRIAESMGKTFGAQQEGGSNDIPKAASALAREFSPGTPEPTALNEIRQKVENIPNQAELDEVVFEKVKEKKKEEMQEQIDKAATEMGKKLLNEILSGIIQIETHDEHIVIRILEQDSFVTGEGEVRPSFIPILTKIRKILESSKGNISIEGHTDDLPVFTSDFRSNWDLSVARAVSVAHLLLEGDNSALDKKRISVSGHADSKPLFANDSKAHRASNRRIEIILSQNAAPDVKHVDQQLKKESVTDGSIEKVTTTPVSKPAPQKVTLPESVVPAEQQVAPAEQQATSLPDSELKKEEVPKEVVQPSSSSIKTSMPDAKPLAKPETKKEEAVKENPANEPATPIKSQQIDQKFLLHE